MIKGVIIEDEVNARETLKILISKYCHNVQLVGEAHDVKSGIACIELHNPDLIFLDIEMPDGDGFELLRKLDKLNFNIIFTTAHSDFAIKAFKYNTIDYLLKPIDPEDLVKAVDKTETELQNKDLSNKFNKLLTYLNEKKEQKKLVLTSNSKYEIINISEIIMCRSDKNYTTFYMEDGQEITVSKTLKDFVPTLTQNRFIRPHRQYLVNVDHIKSFCRMNSSSIKLTLELEAPVSLRKKDAVMEILSQF